MKSIFFQLIDIKISERPNISNLLIFTFADGKQIELLAEKEITAKHWVSILLNLEVKSLLFQAFENTKQVVAKSSSNNNLLLSEGKPHNEILQNTQSATRVLEKANFNKQLKLTKVETLQEVKEDLIKDKKEELSINQTETTSSLIYSQVCEETTEHTNDNLLTEENTKNILEIFDSLKESVEASILSLSSGSSNNNKNNNKEKLEQNSNSNDTNQRNTNEEISENDQNSSSNNTPSEDNNSKKPPYVKLPTFFDPPPPIQYEATLEIQIKKKKRKPPKIIRKLVPASNDLERRSQLLLQGDYPCEKIDFSAASAHRKIRNIKQTFDKSVDSLKYTEDTVEKAKAKNFKNILTPAAVLPIKSRAFDYQYIIEDPKTGLCLSTSEIENFYSPEELEVLIREIEKMEQETKFSSKITTRRIKSEYFLYKKSIVQRTVEYKNIFSQLQ